MTLRKMGRYGETLIINITSKRVVIGGKMRYYKTQYMTFMAMFLAIEIILVVTPLGYIPIGPLSATTMHIPVIIAGITLGKRQEPTWFGLWTN